MRTDFVQFEVPRTSRRACRTTSTRWRRQGNEPRENSLVGWLNADLFVAGLKAAGPNFNRQKLIDAINTDDRLHRRRDRSTASTGPSAHTQEKSDDDVCQFFSKIEDSKFDPTFSRAGQAVRVRGRSNGGTSTRYDRVTTGNGYSNSTARHTA